MEITIKLSADECKAAIESGSLVALLNNARMPYQKTPGAQEIVQKVETELTSTGTAPDAPAVGVQAGAAPAVGVQAGAAPAVGVQAGAAPAVGVQAGAAPAAATMTHQQAKEALQDVLKSKGLQLQGLLNKYGAAKLPDIPAAQLPQFVNEALAL